MAILRITGVPPLDGDYSLDIENLTNRELHLIKQETGLRAGELEDAFTAGDNDLLVVMAMVMLARDGKPASMTKDLLWDAPAGSAITFDFSKDESEKEADKIPPPTEPVSSENDGGRKRSGGMTSDAGGESRQSDQSPTGTPDLVIGAV